MRQYLGILCRSGGREKGGAVVLAGMIFWRWRISPSFNSGAALIIRKLARLVAEAIHMTQNISGWIPETKLWETHDLKCFSRQIKGSPTLRVFNHTNTHRKQALPSNKIRLLSLGARCTNYRPSSPGSTIASPADEDDQTIALDAG